MAESECSAGFLNLSHVPIIRLVGGGQFRKGMPQHPPLFASIISSSYILVCIVALILLVITVWITCWTQEEKEKDSIFGERRSYVTFFSFFSICRHNITTTRKIRDVVGTIYEAVLHLPKPIRRVCIVSLHLLSKKDWLNLKKNGIARFQKVQIAAFMGWFPYLFYSTTYVAEVMAKEVHHKPDIDRATRAGSLALLIYSFGTCCVFVYHHPLPTPLKKKKIKKK